MWEITGLLQALKSIQRPCNLKKFSGQTLGVDGYGWLHRGLAACAADLALDRPTRKHIEWFLHRVRMLIHFGVRPYIVFDGDNLPSKAKTEAGRRERREEAKKEGLALHRAGKASQAYKTLMKAVDVTPEMTHELIQELKKLKVAYVVAPYEADAQLAYLEQKGIIDGVLSEDSDLLVFGVKRLLTKLDQYGNCIEINRKDFSACRDISLAGWTDDDFRRFAILSGCDYLSSLPKMGLRTAHRMVRKYKNVNKILQMIQYLGTIVPPEYAANFEQAERTFIHHRVFCPISRDMVLLSELTLGLTEDEMPYLGPKVEKDIAIGVAEGELNPMTKQSMRSAIVNTSTTAKRRSNFQENRRHTLGTPSDLKGNKRLDSFLQKRTPLAELDPNSLTPSPSQQRLLQRHSNASWVATPSPSPAVQTASRAVRQSDREAFLERAAAVSDYQPPKRQRLCADSLEMSSSGGEIASPFFGTPSKSLPGPSSGKIRKAKRATFGIFSDDSVEDIMQQLPDVGGMSNSTQDRDQEVDEPPVVPIDLPQDAPIDKLNELETAATSLEDEVEAEADLDFIPNSSPPRLHEELSTCLSTEESSAYSRSLTQSNNLDSQSTAATSVGVGEDAEEFFDLLDHHVKSHTARLVQQYAHNEDHASALRRAGNDKEENLAQSSSSSEREAEISKFAVGEGDSPRRATSYPITDNQTSRLRTPLQKLQQPTLRKSKSSNALVPGLQRFTTSSETKDNLAVSMPLQRRSSMQFCRTAPQGSEDLIVPASDGEEDDDLPETRTSLNLGRFAFQAK